MKKSVFGLLVFLFTSSFVLGQALEYPKGVYMSFDEIKRKSPSIMAQLDIERRTKGNIKMNGGNDYKLFKSDKSISKKWT